MARILLAPSAVRERIGATGNPDEVTRALLAALGRGTVYAQADLTIETDHSKTPPAETRARNKGVNREYWPRLATDEDRMAEVWATGTTVLDDPTRSVELCDIGFDEAHVQPIIEKWGIARTKKTFAHTGRPTAEWWSDVVVEMVDLFYNDGVPDGEQHQGAETIIRKIQERMVTAGHKEPSARSIRETVRKTLVRVRGN